MRILLIEDEKKTAAFIGKGRDSYKLLPIIAGLLRD